MSIITVETPSTSKDGNRIWSVVTPPVIEPITKEEVKLFGRIDGTTEDTLIDGFIQSVREATENYLGRALIRQKIRLSLDYWPGYIIEVPRPPLISVEEIKLLDEEDSEEVYVSTNYFVVVDSIPGQIVIRTDCTLPQNTSRFTAGIQVLYFAGYGPLATNVPRTIRDAMMLWVMQIYEQRNLTPEPPPEAKVMLSGFRVIKL